MDEISSRIRELKNLKSSSNTSNNTSKRPGTYWKFRQNTNKILQDTSNIAPVSLKGSAPGIRSTENDLSKPAQNRIVNGKRNETLTSLNNLNEERENSARGFRGPEEGSARPQSRQINQSANGFQPPEDVFVRPESRQVNQSARGFRPPEDGFARPESRQVNQSVSSFRGLENGFSRPGPFHLFNGNRERKGDNGSASRQQSPTKKPNASIRAEPVVLLHDYRKERGNSPSPPSQANDGFAVPTLPPPPRAAVNQFRDSVKTLKSLMNTIADSQPPGDAFYLLKRFEDRFSKHYQQNTMKNVNTRPQDLNSEISNWLLSSKLPAIPELPLGSSATSVVQGPPAAPPSIAAPSLLGHLQPSGGLIKPSSETYLMSGWTLVKGVKTTDLHLLGDIYKPNIFTLVERNHQSSKILAAEGPCVSTAVCTYILNGQLEDPEGSIPNDVKKYFLGGEFPPEWIGITKLWSALKSQGNGRSGALEYGRRPFNQGGGQLDETSMMGADGNENRMQARGRQERTLRRLEASVARLREEIQDERMDYEETDRRRVEVDEDYQDEDDVESRIGTSRRGRKRRLNSQYKDYICYSSQPHKKQHFTPMAVKKTVKTPRYSVNRLSFIANRTRSAIKRHKNLIETPKSSKVNKLKNRRKTPLPSRRRIIDEDSLSIDNSDI